MNAASDSRLFLIGWNFRVASVAVRDRVAFNPDEVREALKRIVGQGLAAESVIVSTCHRSEIYGLVWGTMPICRSGISLPSGEGWPRPT